MINLKKILTCLILVLWIQSFLYAYPKAKALEITAERVEVLQGGRKIYVEGHIILEKPSLLVYAERGIYEPETDLLELYNFKIFDLSQNSPLIGDRAYLDLRNNEIHSDQIFLAFKNQGIKIKAWDFKKNALNEYTAKKALLTTCEMDCEKEIFPPWSIEVKDLLFTSEGLSTAEATTFRMKSLPFLYLPKKLYTPKVSLPILEPRKAGFLFPGIFQGSRLGFGLQIPYFLPLTDQFDFTFSPLFTTKRGILWDIENQVALTDDIRGIFKIRYLKDTEKLEYATEKAPKERYWITGKIDFSTQSNWDLHLDLDFLSDKGFLEELNLGEGGFDNVKGLYLERFKRDIGDKTQDHRQSTLWLQYTKNSFYQRLQSSYLDYEGLGDKREVFQPLFSLRSSLLPFEFKNLLPSLSLDYNYFYREKNYYGHRWGLNWELTYPFTYQFLKSEFKINYKNFFYFLSKEKAWEDKNLNFNLLETTLSLYSLLYKSYFIELGKEPLKFQHTLKPYATFYYKKPLNNSAPPFFIYEDTLVAKKKGIEYGLWQYFSSEKQKNFLIINAYQFYDLSKDEMSITSTSSERRSFSDLSLRLIAQWKDFFSLKYDTTYNFYGYGLKKHTFSFNLRNLVLDNIGFIYQEDKAWNTKQVNLNLSYLLKDKLLVNYYASKNLKTKETTEQKIEGLYLHDCYLLGLGAYITPKETNFFFRVELKGLGGLGERRLPF